MKKHAPATLRNREAILVVLAKELPQEGTVLEIAAGSGEHAMYFAEGFPALQWLPTDPSPDALASIAAYRADCGLGNVREPVALDVSAADWPLTHGVQNADAIVCINMIHISPWAATQGLLAGAAQVLRGATSPLIVYGPYFEDGVESAPSNVDFDLSLRMRDQSWGIRQREELDALAADYGFRQRARYEMPANNLSLVYRRA
ncbi:MAG: DUF938 domain-containing protein [Erythrobacter sp.]